MQFRNYNYNTIHWYKYRIVQSSSVGPYVHFIDFLKSLLIAKPNWLYVPTCPRLVLGYLTKGMNTHTLNICFRNYSYHLLEHNLFIYPLSIPIIYIYIMVYLLLSCHFGFCWIWYFILIYKKNQYIYICQYKNYYFIKYFQLVFTSTKVFVIKINEHFLFFCCFFICRICIIN